MTKTTRLRIGSVSHGTMMPEDLIPIFLGVADELRMSRAQQLNVKQLRAEWNHIIERGPDFSDEDGDAMGQLLETLFEQLNDFCPPYTYFGAHEGDGSDYGCWPCLPESDDPDVGRSAELPRAGSVEQEYWVTVNDHGNCTLYRKIKSGRGYRWHEEWSIV